ncbi:MAG: hypothetical protein Q8K32_11135 [Archangium sp.]|nr:hypothetical protein [Archangium sp.]
MRAKNVDANQVAIVAALRAAGATVQHLHEVGAGCPDLLVGVAGLNVLLEVKNPAVKGELNAEQVKWHRNWRGQVQVVTTASQAFNFVRQLENEARR